MPNNARTRDAVRRRRFSRPAAAAVMAAVDGVYAILCECVCVIRNCAA